MVWSCSEITLGASAKKKSSLIVNCLIAVCLSPPQSVVKRIEHMEMRYINTVIIIIIIIIINPPEIILAVISICQCHSQHYDLSNSKFLKYCQYTQSPHGRRGGLMVSALDSRSGGLVSSPGRGTALCSWTRYFNLIVPLFS